MKNNIKHGALAGLALSALLMLAGCGGGGGSSGGTASTPMPTMPMIPPDNGGGTTPTTPPTTMPTTPGGTPATPTPPSGGGGGDMPPQRVVSDTSSGGGGTTTTPISTPTPDTRTSATTIAVPTSLIPSAGAGVKDRYFMAGGGYGGDVRNYYSSIYPDGITAFGKRVQDRPNAPLLTLYNAPRDVRSAWREGWTGQGVNLMIIDGFGAPGRTGATHGYGVGASAVEVAPGANYYALDVGLDPFLRYRARSGVLRNVDNDRVSRNTRIDVINMSFGTDPIVLPISDTELRRRIIALDNHALYNDVLGGRFITNAGDAVLVKAAGNESADTSLVLENLAMVYANVTKPKILIVGALNRYAQFGNAQLAGYSNYAGVLPEMQERFLVEYGGSPFVTVAGICDAGRAGCQNRQLVGTAFSLGTSYAAPRVAGHAALVRHKFPGISGPQTAKILLDTATYEGLFCHPRCAVNIYGQGHVDIADALSPIGKLE